MGAAPLQNGTNLFPFQVHQSEDDGDPVKYVREDRTHCVQTWLVIFAIDGRQRPTRSIVGPPKDSVEDRPALAADVVVWIATIQVPDVALHTVRSRSISPSVISVRPQQHVVCVLLKGADRTRKKSSSDEKQQVRHDDKEDGQSWIPEVIRTLLGG